MNKDCISHPGFYNPLEELIKKPNGQALREQLEKDPAILPGFTYHIASLNFDKFFNECFTHLLLEDNLYYELLRDVAQNLFNLYFPS